VVGILSVIVALVMFAGDKQVEKGEMSGSVTGSGQGMEAKREEETNSL
jgi:hypothetical protein